MSSTDGMTTASGATTAGIGELPAGWEQRYTPDGRAYFVNQNTRTTTLADPRRNQYIHMYGNNLAGNNITIQQQPVSRLDPTTNAAQAASPAAGLNSVRPALLNMHIDEPGTSGILREEIKLQRVQLQNRLEQAKHPAKMSDGAAIDVLLAVIKTEVSYQLFVLADVLSLDPRQNVNWLDALEKVAIECWCKHMKPWKTAYKLKHGREMDMSLPTPCTILNLLNEQASVVKEVCAPEAAQYFQAAGERPRTATQELKTNAVKRTVLLEQAKIIKDFTGQWETARAFYARHNPEYALHTGDPEVRVKMPFSAPPYPYIDPNFLRR
jgi:hypothetical protein